MQRNISTAHGGHNTISSDDLNYKLHYSPFTPSPSASNSPADSTISYHTPISSDPSLQGLEFAFSPSPQSVLVQEQQDLVNSHSFCLTRLREATKESEALHRENTTLRVANRDLNDKIDLLIQSAMKKQVMPSDYMSNLMVSAMRGLCVDGERSGGKTEDYQQGFVQSPTSVIDNRSCLADGKSGGVERVALPKSISVRSNGYLKANQTTGNVNHGGQTRSLNLPQTASSTNPAQRVYVRGGKKEGEAVELEAYDQGMIKTELCNKWQETGACPYDDHCQFAHGIHELRPVIRHPRYKTEVCRMVLSGDPCPYGHRCHFRHALTEEEKLIAAYNHRGLKLKR